MIAKYNISRIIIAMASAFVIAGGISAEENQTKLNVIPDRIEIGAFYHGTRITVTADVDSCDEAVVVLGAAQDVIHIRTDKILYLLKTAKNADNGQKSNGYAGTNYNKWH